MNIEFCLFKFGSFCMLDNWYLQACDTNLIGVFVSTNVWWRNGKNRVEKQGYFTNVRGPHIEDETDLFRVGNKTSAYTFNR